MSVLAAIGVVVFLLVIAGVIAWGRRPARSKRQREEALRRYARDVDADQ